MYLSHIGNARLVAAAVVWDSQNSISKSAVFGQGCRQREAMHIRRPRAERQPSDPATSIWRRIGWKVRPEQETLAKIDEKPPPLKRGGTIEVRDSLDSIPSPRGTFNEAEVLPLRTVPLRLWATSRGLAVEVQKADGGDPEPGACSGSSLLQRPAIDLRKELEDTSRRARSVCWGADLSPSLFPLFPDDMPAAMQMVHGLRPFRWRASADLPPLVSPLSIAQGDEDDDDSAMAVWLERVGRS